MAVSKISNNQAFIQVKQADRASVKPLQKTNVGRRDTASLDHLSGLMKSRKSCSAFERLQNVKSDFNKVARNIRSADMTMVKINDYISKMKARLKAIMKNYPPFPPGSEERVRYLKSFNLFKKQIDKMMMGAEKYGAKKIMADPKIVKGAGDWEIKIGDDDFRNTIQSQQAHTGLAGFSIHALPESASDADIEAALTDLDSAEETLIEKRDALAENAFNMMRSVEFSAEANHVYLNSQEGSESNEMKETDAENKGAELTQKLSVETYTSLTQIHSEFEDLLGLDHGT